MTKDQILARNQSLKSLREEELTADDLTYLLVSNPAIWAETLTSVEIDGESQPLRLEPFQINYLNDRSTFRIANKSRQVGFSLLISLETAHSATTKRNYKANIVSTGEKEAKEKLQMGNALYNSISDDPEYQIFKPIQFRNAEDEIAFHMPPNTSSVISKPGTASIRGGKKDMYYDEAAFIPQFETLWQAGVPATLRGRGRATVISTPMGQSGLYYELWNQQHWSHHYVPWWFSRFMVNGADLDMRIEGNYEKAYEIVSEAMEFAPGLSTEDRVDRFGSEKIKNLLYIGLRGDIIAFKTEFECTFVDEAGAFFPYELVRSGVDKEIPLLRAWPDEFKSEFPLSIGVDLASKRDATVFTVVEHRPNNKAILFFYESHAQYDEQFDELRRYVGSIRPFRLTIDETGAGVPFLERARRGELLYPVSNIEGVFFNSEKKERWATTFKSDLQVSKVKYPDQPEFIAQTHGIKRTRTETGRFKFAGVKDDYFWSAMLALYGEDRMPVKFHLLK